MGNCKSEVINLNNNSENDFFTKRNTKPLPKSEDIFLNIVKIQSEIRGCLVRRKYQPFLESIRNKKLIQNLQNYARQILSSRHLPYEVFDYSSSNSSNDKSIKLSIKKLETSDSKITYFGEWSIFFSPLNFKKL